VLGAARKAVRLRAAKQVGPTLLRISVVRLCNHPQQVLAECCLGALTAGLHPTRGLLLLLYAILVRVGKQ
jgi:hypothetical protein